MQNKYYKGNYINITLNKNFYTKLYLNISEIIPNK